MVYKVLWCNMLPIKQGTPTPLHGTMSWFTRCCGAICYQSNQEQNNNTMRYVLKYETLTFWMMRHYSFKAPCNGLHDVVAQYAANQTRNTGANLFSFLYKCAGLFYVRYTTHGTNGFTSHPKDKQWLSVYLAKKCLDWGSNPHSAEQKHQSLNSVLLTARPRHFH